MHWYINCLKHYADFNGRARRKEYWFFTLFDFIFISVTLFLSIPFTIFSGLGDSYIHPMNNITLIILGLYYVPTFIPRLAVLTRRLHDTGHSMFFAIVPCILTLPTNIINSSPTSLPPVLSFSLGLVSLFSMVISIICFVFTLFDSDTARNQYGPSPKYADGSTKCTFCGGTIASGNTFCSHCGRKKLNQSVSKNIYIEQCTCPHCNTSTDANRDFCMKCGRPLPIQVAKAD